MVELNQMKKNFEQPNSSYKERKPEKEKADFDFTAKDVLDALRTNRGGPKIEYIGSATSDFQAEPLILDSEGKPFVVSDWEFELVKNIEGKKSKIRGIQKVEEFPHFHAEKEKYIKRSAELGENMFRFSLDFARLCPKEGEFNEALMADYVKALGLIKARGLEPMLTIFHWPMPEYLVKRDRYGEIEAGGWENPEAAKHFRFYVEQVIKFIADENKVRGALSEEGFDKNSTDKFLSEGLVRYFLTINEPKSILGNGYIAGIFPPFKKGNVFLFREVLGKLVEAHDIAFNEIKSGKLKLPPERDSKVGAVYNWDYFDGVFGEFLHKTTNEYPTKSIERNGAYSDFLGLDYYCRATVPALYPPIGPYKPKDRDYGEHPGFGDIYPRGIYEQLKRIHKEYPQKEIFITEFGFSDKNDKRRPYWILETTRYIIEALKHDVPVKGMLLWSLVNNFEWNLGMDQKFGMFDESELKKELKGSPVGDLRSWEVWKAVTKAITDPKPESLQELQTIYERAKSQFIINSKT